MTVTLIAAVAANRVIGRDGGLPWHLPADLKRFKRLTMGHHLIVGRTTWETLGKPLPGRTFLVVSRQPGYRAEGAAVRASLEEALALAREAGDPEPYVAGGAAIYREAFARDLLDRLQITAIHRAYAGDTLFPDFDRSRWRLVEREEHAAEPEADRPGFEFQVYERVGTR